MKKGLINNKENIENTCTKISYVVSAIVVIILGYYLSFIPNELDIEYIMMHYIANISDFVAEKSEMIMYIVLTITFPIVFVIFSKIFQVIFQKFKCFSIHAEKISCLISTIITIALLVLTIYTFLKQPVYLLLTVLYNNPLVFYFGFIAIWIGVLYYEKNDKKMNYFICGVSSIIAMMVSYLFVNATCQLNEDMVHHIDAYYYPIRKIIDGLVPGIDFNSLYGYYSYFYAGILKWIPCANRMYIFSVINAIFVLIILMGVIYLANKFIKNKMIVFLTVTSIIFARIIAPLAIDESYYLQYMPHRILFPIIILVYIVYYNSKKNHIFLYRLFGFFISSLAIFWNLETGIVVLAVWSLTLVYETLYFHALFSKETWLKIVGILLETIISIVTYFIFINLITLVKSGHLIHIADILSSQTLFAGTGFFMLKMPLWSPWLLLVIIYSIALAKTLSSMRFLKENINASQFYKNQILFALVILGMGIFSYYEGRSHWKVLLGITYPGILVLGILLDEKLVYLNQKFTWKIAYQKIIVFSGILFLSILTISGFYEYLTNRKVSQFTDKNYLNENLYLQEDIQNIKKLQEKVENIQLIIPSESYYYTGLNLTDTKQFPAYVDIFTYDDIEKIYLSIKENQSSWCIQQKIYDILEKQYKEQLEEIIESNYTKYRWYERIILIQDTNLNSVEQLEGMQKIEE